MTELGAPRSAEQVIRDGDLGKCQIRELMDLVAELRLDGEFEDGYYGRQTVLRVLRTYGQQQGWYSPEGCR